MTPSLASIGDINWIPVEVGRTKRYTAYERIQKFLQQTALPLTVSGQWWATGGSSCASATAARAPCGASPGDAGRSCAGGGRGSSAYEAAVSASASASGAASERLVGASGSRSAASLLFYCRHCPPGMAICQSTPTRPGPFSTSIIRATEAIQAPKFESHAAFRHDQFLRRDWAI